MLLVKKCQFFHYFVWLKIRLEIRFNNVLDRKETFFDYKRKISESPKNCIFPKGKKWSKNANSFFIWFWSKQD